MEKLHHLAKNDLAEELSGQYEGDIVISEEQLRNMEAMESIDNVEEIRRIGLRDDRYRWSDGIVPYTIDKSYYSNSY